MTTLMESSQFHDFKLQFLTPHMQEQPSDKASDYLDEYRLLQTLGEGYHATLAHDPNGNPLAIKIYKHTATLDTLRHELEVMKQFSHENVVRLVSVREQATLTTTNEKVSPCLAIVLEYAGGGELFDYVAETGKFSEAVARTYFGQMLNGLHHIHSRGYAHRDIKPQNILLSDKHILKLADFGFSVLLAGRDGSGVLRTRLGTQGYMAPQIQSKKYDGRKVDTFAAGVILFIMYAGVPPFESSQNNDPYFKCLRNKKYDVFWKSHSRKRPAGYFSPQFRDLFQKMVAPDPEQRPSIQQLAQHPWCKQKLCSYQQISDQFSQRKQKLHTILAERRKEQEQRRKQKEEGVRNQGAAHRSGEDTSEFNKIYGGEFVIKRALKQLPPLVTDIQISGDPVLSVALLKSHLVNQKIYRWEQSLLTSDIGEEKEDVLIFEKLQDSPDNHMQVSYGFSYEVDEFQFTDKLVIDLHLGVKQGGKELLVRPSLVQGSDLYYRRAVADLRALV